MNLHTRFTLDPDSGFVHDAELNTWHTTAQEVFEAILDHSADRKHGVGDTQTVAIVRSGEVWMSPRLGPCVSSSRELATLCLHALGMEDEFRNRDKIINAINPRLTAMLDEVFADRKPTPAEVPATGTRDDLILEVHNARRVPYASMSPAAKVVLSVEWKSVEWYSRDAFAWVPNSVCPRQWNEEAYRVPPHVFPPPTPGNANLPIGSSPIGGTNAAAPSPPPAPR